MGVCAVTRAILTCHREAAWPWRSRGARDSFRRPGSLRSSGLALTALLSIHPSTAASLRVCLDGRNPPFSAEGGAGFDVGVARAVATRLGQEFTPVWYEDARDNNRSATLDAGALLAAGRCDLVAGFPLTEGAVAEPAAPSARLPSYAGGPPPRKLPRVGLQELGASRPYYRLGFIVVLRAEKVRTVSSLADLAGLRVGAPAATLAGALLLGYRRGALGMISLDSRAEALAALEAGQLDATLVEAGTWSRYRAAHPETALRDSGFRHRIGFNTGFIALATDTARLDAVSAALTTMLADGTAARLAGEAGLPWVPPASPDIAPRLTPAALMAE